jgi:exodeoxyribonuclease VII large subunit
MTNDQAPMTNAFLHWSLVLGHLAIPIVSCTTVANRHLIMPVNSSAPKPRIFSVAQLTRRIQDSLAETCSGVWVSGEISELTRHGSGHLYLTLKDESAQIRGVVWRSTAIRLPFQLREGQHVICGGDVEVYPPRGSYQLVIRLIEPVGLGAQQLALQQLKQKLAAEGLFDPRRKKPLPVFPRRIAFVTSPSGAAVRDFLQVASRRWRGIQLLVIPAKVQGDGAAEEIVRGIRAAHRLKQPPDVLVVGRGGGSVEDLWCFNDEKVVRAIHAATIPVVSAVGHEIDITLADLVADVRALTPSEAAERIVPAVDELKVGLGKLGQRLTTALRSQATSARHRLESLAARRVLRRPFELIQQRSLQLDELSDRARRAMWRHWEQSRRQTASLTAHLESLSPLGVLARGYSVTMRENGEVVREAASLATGELLRTQLASGEFTSRVEEVKPETS